ncbi:MAG: efflux RND transporter periplasmic adaptor subunit [Bacteroides sp.]|nr:efflux RND transporter periplasmic adaptor subunit [Bacteroides sp.]
MKNRKWILIALVVVVAGIVAWLVWGGTPKHRVTYVTTEVARRDINTSVTATGTLEPVTQVEVGTQVSGIVDKIYVDYNSEVKKGQVIAELDKINLLNSLATSKSNLASAQVELEYQERNYERMKALYDRQLIAATDYETAFYSYQTAKNAYDVSRNNLARAETDLGYATIYSPIDGVVLSKDVEEGQTVAASFSTPTLFLIANDLTAMQVIADVDEADIGEVTEGLRVNFTVDAFPNDIFEGFVTQVRQEATVTSNVVTYEVVISAHNPDLKLKPGMTANTTIYTLERRDVLSVSSKALRFTPEPILIGKEDEVIDTEAPYKLWTREGNVFRAHGVEIGITNGMLTEIISGIAEGTQVVSDISIGMPGEGNGNGNNQQGSTNPFMPGPPGRRR